MKMSDAQSAEPIQTTTFDPIDALRESRGMYKICEPGVKVFESDIEPAGYTIQIYPIWPDEDDIDNFAYRVIEYKLDEARVLIEKQMDYGPKNISACPVGPLQGLVVRLFDKLSRLGNLLQKGGEPKNESLEDTFLDIANYGTIGSMNVKGDWPE